MKKTPKSYLPAEEREAILREGGMNLVYLIESQKAGKAGDEETAWAWLALADIPAYSLMACKDVLGADFIRKVGLRTAPADAAYGPGWLDQPLRQTAG
ncbi:MAG: hypothetical protein LBM17_03350 [Candidatus Accumulibacter sp.]|jgi:hypothetical protein|nr:hypothetical protein [Accumulibacter sp.]